MNFLRSLVCSRGTSMLVALALATTTATACVEEIGLIDRTQPAYLAKTDLRGVWYELSVVTDMPASAGFSFVGMSNFGGEDNGKVMFDLQEKFLVVYPYTEKVLGGDAKWNKKKIRKYWDKSLRDRKKDKNGKVAIDTENDFIEVVVGNPSAMFPITHFDRIRDYSASTGKQGNVLSENMTDRPWWQREYVRVDWMGGQLSNIMNAVGTVKYSAVDYFVPESEVDNPNRFFMEPEGGYFHFTRRLFGQPMTTGACSTYSLAPGDCAGAAFDVRIAYRRVDPKRLNDFEVRRYQNAGPQEKFGFFLAERQRFDEDYGLTTSGKDEKASRWNLWQRSKTFLPVDAAGKILDTKDIAKAKTCYSNRDCAMPAVCDQEQWFEKGHCALGARMEYTKRGIRPIVYHLSAGHPVNHLQPEYETGDNWSDVFKDTISWLYFWEEKWGQDKIASFTDPLSRYGQRFCASHAECAQHAVAQTTVSAKGSKISRVVIAAGIPGGKVETITVEDDTLARDKPLGGGSYVVFVNATPGSAPATLKIAGATVSDIKYAAGIVAGKGQAIALSKDAISASATTELTVTAGAKTASLPNFKLATGEAYIIAYVGGDTIAVARASTAKFGLRAINGVATKEIADKKVSDGEGLDVGVNGVRVGRDPLPFGQVSEFAFFTSETAHVTFVRAGGRGDVSCITVNGVGQCVGWAQQLTSADEARQVAIKAGLEEVFVVCENVFTRSHAKCVADGQMSKPKGEVLNDCRYWRETKGKFQNPCADIKDGGFVASAAKPKILGDLRYNYLYWVTNVHSSSPLGYGPSAADPDTGETVWGVAHVYGASMMTFTQYAKDLVDLINGDLKVDDLVSGKYIKEYLARQSQTAKDKTLFEGALGEATKAALDKEDRGDAEDTAHLRATVSMADRAAGLTTAGSPTADAATREMLRGLENPEKLRDVLNEALPSFDMNLVFANLDRIKGTGVERAMINDEVALVLSEGEVQPGEALSPEMLGKISPTGWATPRRQMDENKRMTMLGIQNIHLAEFQDPSLLGLAKRLACKPGQLPTDKYDGADKHIFDKACYKGDALRTALSVAIFKGVMEHEVGHTIGLRHNFEASTDLINYFDGYFHPETGREREAVLCAQLTTKTGVVIPANSFCQDDDFGESCVFDLKCKTDADCPASSNGVLACDKSGQCIDANSQKVGTCHGNVVQRLACSAATAATTCGAQGACKDGFCEDAVACVADKGCGDGELCKDKVCTDAKTGRVRTTPVKQENKERLIKYVPRPQMTQKEIENRRTEYQYSSVMDYGQRVHADIHGLGKYDYAAIKFGYGEMVEVFADTKHLIAQTRVFAKNTGQSFEAASDRMETMNWQYAGRVTTSLNIPNDWMPPELNRKRWSVAEHMVTLEEIATQKYGRDYADKTFFEVPYKYCADEFRGNLGCYYFDMGVSPEEIVHHAGEMLEEYYLFDAFKRERLWFGRGGSPLGYMARIQDRWLNPLGDAGRFYALFNNIYRIYGWFTPWENNEFGLLPLKRASEDAFRRLTNLITTPAPGKYELDATTGDYANVSYECKPTDTECVPLGVGKMPWTTFATQKGYYYFNHPKWIGGYWDKVAAIQAMTNSSANFLSDFVGEQLPLFRGTAIGFNTIYPKELAKVLGGLAAGDLSEIGGTFVNGVYSPMDPFAPANPNAANVPPSVMNDSLRLTAAWQAIANLPAGFDPSFTDSMAVWLKGNGKQYNFSGSKLGAENVAVKVVEFEDPFGKKTYVAPKPNYFASSYSPTYKMLQKLNLLKTGCADGVLCENGKCGTTGPDGSGAPVNCSSAPYWSKATGSAKFAIEQDMRREIEMIDYFRELYTVYGAIGLGM